MFSPPLSSIALSFLEQAYNAFVMTTPLLEGDHPQIVFVNDAFCRMTGYEKSELLGKTPRILQGEKSDRPLLDSLKQALLEGEFFEGETINYKKDGTPYWVQWNISSVYDQQGELIAYCSFQKDITIERMFASHIRLFQQAIDQNRDHIALFDAKGRYIYVNDAYAQRTKMGSNELLGHTPRVLKSDQHSQSFYQNLWQKLLEGESYDGIFINKNSQGEIYYEKQTITPLFEKGEVTGFVAIGKSYDHDIALQHDLVRKSRLDPLTLLPNRLAFEEDLVHFIENFTLHRTPFATLFVDIDHFKQVNDTQGHDVGDEALRGVGSFLNAALRKGDHVYRLGGDEFVFLLPQTSQDHIPSLIEKIQALFDASVFPSYYGIGLSIGGATFEGEGVEEFLRKADQKMYEHKMEKRGTN